MKEHIRPSVIRYLLAAVLAIEALKAGRLEVAPLQSYFKGAF